MTGCILDGPGQCFGRCHTAFLRSISSVLRESDELLKVVGDIFDTWPPRALGIDLATVSGLLGDRSKNDTHTRRQHLFMVTPSNPK